MGTSTDAILVYGYNFGNEEALELREAEESDANPYGYLKTSWYDAETADEDENEDEDEEGGGLFTLMIRRLYDHIAPAGAAEWDDERATVVKERLGVEFVSHCSNEYPMQVLAAAAFTASRGNPVEVDVARLAADPVAGGWDVKLAEALRILDVTPKQGRAGWLLVSNWG